MGVTRSEPDPIAGKYRPADDCAVGRFSPSWRTEPVVDADQGGQSRPARSGAMLTHRRRPFGQCRGRRTRATFWLPHAMGQGGSLPLSRLARCLMARHQDCIRASELERWRSVGDPLSDAVVRCLRIGPGKDGLQVLLDYLAATPSDRRDPAIAEFWAQVSGLPPDDISAAAFGSDGKPELTPRRALGRMTRSPDRTVAGGQAVFWRYAGEIFTTLMHYSLAGGTSVLLTSTRSTEVRAGFSAPRVMSVLRETNYLSGDNRQVTYRRLLETTQFILDAMVGRLRLFFRLELTSVRQNDLTPITGLGWKSAIRVRFLHSHIRLRILDSKGIRNVYSIEADGIPINQECVAQPLVRPLRSSDEQGPDGDTRLVRRRTVVRHATHRHPPFARRGRGVHLRLAPYQASSAL